MTQQMMQLEDWLDDLCVRFIINLPEEDLSSVARICFQVEEAQWFYEDFIRPLDPSLPSMSLRSFCLRIFQHCPLLSAFSLDNHMSAFDEFLLYKTRVPVRGAILLNHEMDSVLLVKGWKKGANWSFPRGKINKDEDDLDCAIREVYEETGYDIKAAGLVPEHDEVKYIEVTMREQHMRLYVFRDVPMDTHFEPRTRKEISKIEWYRLSNLPAFRRKGQQGQDGPDLAVNANKFYMVAPFLAPLKKWVVKQKQTDAHRAASHQAVAPTFVDDGLTEEEPFVNRNESYRRAPSSQHNAPPGVHQTALDITTAELQRMLKIQPPTQGLQSQTASATHPQSDQGGALLALLQNKNGASKVSSHPAPSWPPHTPLDLAYNETPVSRTPNHHQTSMHISDVAPSPSFPPQTDPRQFHGQSQQNLYPPPSQGIYPYHLPPQNGLHFQQAQQASFQTEALQHPQPLPPQVQKILFTGGPVHSPMVRQPAEDAQLREIAQSNRSDPEKAVHAVAVPPTSAQPIELNDHRLSMLNVFKGQGTIPARIETQNKHPGPGLNNNVSSQATQELSTDKGQPLMTDTRPTLASPSVSGQLSPRLVRDEKHISTLLSLFKPGANTTPGINSSPSQTETKEVSEVRSHPAIPMATHIPNNVPHTKDIAQPVVPSAFRPTSILPRPTQGTKADPISSLPTFPQGSNKATISRTKVEEPFNGLPDMGRIKVRPSAHSELPFQPQILRRPKQNPGDSIAELEAPAASTTHSATANALDALLGKKPSAHTENLLSLFRKPSAGVQGFPLMQPDAAPKPRLGSITPSEDSLSRRGSGNTISAAGRADLLGRLKDGGI